MKSMVFSLILVFTLSSYGQFKKVDTYTASNKTLIATGDPFEIGPGSAKDGTYFYITMKPDIAGPAAYPLQKGKEGRKYMVELIRKLKNPFGGLTGATIIFKSGTT